jgi:hypothetical protein
MRTRPFFYEKIFKVGKEERMARLPSGRAMKVGLGNQRKLVVNDARYLDRLT